MKVLLDEDVPHKLLPFLRHHAVHLIEREGFDVFLTGDKSMPDQQRLDNRPFAVLLMSAINWPVVRPYVNKIVSAVDKARVGTVTMIDCGAFGPRT